MFNNNYLEPVLDRVLSLAIEAIEVGVWDYNIDLDTLDCNQRWCDIVGVDRDTVKTIADFQKLIHPEDIDLATRIDDGDVAELIEKQRKYSVEFRIIRPDGEIRLIRSVACVVRDSRTYHRRAVGCVTDITGIIKQTSDISSMQPDGIPSTEPDHSPAIDENPLSDKERECLKWVSVGKTAWETATIIKRSPRTVEFHLANAVRKLRASNKIHAAVIALRNGSI